MRRGGRGAAARGLPDRGRRSRGEGAAWRWPASGAEQPGLGARRLRGRPLHAPGRAPPRLRAGAARVVRRGGRSGSAAPPCTSTPEWRPTGSTRTGSTSTPACASRASTAVNRCAAGGGRSPPSAVDDRSRRAARPRGGARAGGARRRVDAVRRRRRRRGGGGALHRVPAARGGARAGLLDARARPARPPARQRRAAAAAGRSPRHGRRPRGASAADPRRGPPARLGHGRHEGRRGAGARR